MDLKYTGQVLRNNQGKASIYISEPMGVGIIYRGQNEDFGSFKASFQRDKIGSFKHCKKYIQKQTFLCWYKQTPYYKHFISKKFMGGEFALDQEAVAQHYGFATNYLDITLKWEIAKFFAYTYYDEERGEYFPLEKFEGKTPPCIYTSCNNALYDPFNKDFVIVGFQVLPRPMLQYALALDLSNPRHNYYNLFQKTFLPEDAKEARNIYDAFYGGEALFPQDIAGFMQHKIEKHKGLNKHIFKTYCEEFNINSENKNKLKNEISENGYYFDENHYIVSKEEQTSMQQEIDNNIIPWININIQPPRLTYIPS